MKPNTIFTLPSKAILRLKSRVLSFLGVLLVSLVVPHAALAGNLVQNGSFQTGDFTDWTLSGDTGAAHVVIGGGPNGENTAYFNPNGDFVYLSQNLNPQGLNPNNLLYSLVFDWHLVDLPPDIDAVYWNGGLIFQGNPGGSFNWQEMSFNNLPGNPNGQNVLEFAFMTSSDQSYFELTDISVTPQGTTPEPSSMMLVGSGILGLAGVLRRRLL